MKLKFIVPITSERFEKESREEARGYESYQVSIDVERIARGAESIESRYDKALCQPDIIRLGLESARQGYDGIFISCMADPGVDALRELLDIPVVGPCRTAMLYCADIAHKFAVITVTDGVVAEMNSIARDVGVAGKLVYCKAINIPVLELVDTDKMVAALAGLAVEAIEQNDAQAIMLGCTGMVGANEKVMDVLKSKGYEVPVLYPVELALRHLETMVSLRIMQSHRAYVRPAEKERNILGLLGKQENDLP